MTGGGDDDDESITLNKILGLEWFAKIKLEKKDALASLTAFW